MFYSFISRYIAEMNAERNPPADALFLTRPITWLTEQLLRAPLVVLGSCVALALVCLGLALNGLEFQTSPLELINRRSEFYRRWLNYTAEFGEHHDAVIMIRRASVAEFGPVVDELAAELRKQPRYFDLVLDKRDLTALRSKFLHFVPAADLNAISEYFAQAQRLGDCGCTAADPVEKLREWNNQLSKLGKTSPEIAAELLHNYMSLADGLTPSLQTGGTATYPLPVMPTISVDDENHRREYLLTADQRGAMIHLRFVADRKGKIAAPLAELRALIYNAQSRHRLTTITLAGQAIQSHAEQQWGGIGFLGCGFAGLLAFALLYFALLGDWKPAALVMIVIFVSTAWTLGLVTLFLGNLHSFSLCVGLVLLAIGVDFVVFPVCRYLAKRKQGLDCSSAIQSTMTEIGPRIIPTACALLAACWLTRFAEHSGLAELGTASAIALVTSLLATFLCVPALLALQEQLWPEAESPTQLPVGGVIAGFHAWPSGLALLGVLLAVFLSAGVSRVQYDPGCQLFGSELNEPLSHAVSVCESREELNTQRERFRQLPTVGRVEELGSLAPEHAPVRARTIARIQEGIVAIRRQQRPQSVAANQLNAELLRAQELLTTAGLYRSVAFKAIQRLIEQLAAYPEDEATRQLQTYRENLRSETVRQCEQLVGISDPLSPSLTDLPRELTARFVGRTQRHLLKVYPRTEPANLPQLQSFVSEIESVDPFVTGHPVNKLHAAMQLQRSLFAAGLLAVIAFTCVVYLDLQSFQDTGLAVVCGLAVCTSLIGLWGWWNIVLQPRTFVVFPLLFAKFVLQAVDGIHQRRSGARSQNGEQTSTNANLLSWGSTATLGVLMFAPSSDWASIGRLIAVGTLGGCVSSLIFFPAVLRWFSTEQPTQMEPSTTADSEEFSDSEEFQPLVQPRRRTAA